MPLTHDPDPAIIVKDLQGANKKVKKNSFFLQFFLLITF